MLGKMRLIRLSGLRVSYIRFTFLLKLVIGALILLMYDGHYEDRSKADVYKFYDDGEVLKETFWVSPVKFLEILVGADDFDHKEVFNRMQNWHRPFEEGYANDNHFMIRMSGVMHVLFGSFPYTHMVVVVFLWILGAVALYRALSDYVIRNRWLLALFLWVPSLLFWQSAFLKETIVTAGIGFLLFGLTQFSNGKRWFIVVGLILSLWVKTYVLFVIIPAVLFAIILRKAKPSQVMVGGGSVLCLVLVGILLLPKTEYGKSKLDQLVQKQTDFIRLAEGGTYAVNDTIQIFIPHRSRQDVIIQNDSLYYPPGEMAYVMLNAKSDTIIEEFDGGKFKVIFDQLPAGSRVNVPEISDDAGVILRAIPGSLFNAFLVPFPFQFGGVQHNVAALENILFVLLLIGAVIWHKAFAQIRWNQVLAALFVIGALCVLIGITTPVAGAIVRYKTPILPLVLYVCCLLMNRSKIPHRINQKIRWVEQFILQEPVPDSERQ